MIPDAPMISDALHHATAALFTDSELAARARTGGLRRLRRRRIGAAVTVAAALTVAGPLSIALSPVGSRSTLNVGASGRSGSGATRDSGPTTPGSTGALYATPPPADVTCYIGADTSPTDPASPAVDASYPQLLMLPADKPVSSAFTNVYPFADAGAPGCEPVHVALTLLKTAGSAVTQGILVQGPDAPTPSNSFPRGASADCGCREDHPQVQGQPAIALAEPAQHDNKTDVFWSDSSGAQWRAQSVGISEAALVDVLNRLQLDAHAGTANLPNATTDGWTIEPKTPDPHGPTAAFYATCGDVDLIVSRGPDRTYQDAASMPDRQLVTIQGHPANLVADNGMPSIAWQASDDVRVQVSANNPMTVTRLEQIASTVKPVKSNDPRLATH